MGAEEQRRNAGEEALVASLQKTREERERVLTEVQLGTLRVFDEVLTELGVLPPGMEQYDSTGLCKLCRKPLDDHNGDGSCKESKDGTRERSEESQP